ncbi:DUF445 family protein [Paraglaciecola psychrophila]|uniref:DUF445 domain-containing protein n=1 Tax=Paraglaciecola psychrophila 170 TaxID=1129794 RepID=K7ADJ0_9ALTE|nr:DUF445 family protein [Paraglaciecola psychrophila]AGH46963.1 hypothetical protein C427_4864 [Paraglaciecola psychrophila 170]GAC40282.1 hypothetical protein GPSY_4679 [Paraglaciecola psychrophila 170]
MNKSIITNGLAIALVFVGFFLDNIIVKTVGLFAVSGAITNWLAIHMLFEKVPGLYGSGVIPQRFEDFKSGIRTLVMEQFFSEENIQRFLADSNQPMQVDFAPIIRKVDLAPTFDSLVEVIKASSFGQMLGMFGGVEALEPMRQPFVEKMGSALADITQDPKFVLLLQEELTQPGVQQDLHVKINQIVEQRLDELTPDMVKDIIQSMIREHLGWLVVWGGVFGGLIGLLAALFNV